jgi:hypothetical protein
MQDFERFIEEITKVWSEVHRVLVPGRPDCGIRYGL